MKCDPMPQFKGNKSEKILQMVDIVIKKQIKAKIPLLIKQNGLDKLHEAILAKQAELDTLKKKMETACLKACLRYGSYYEDGQKAVFHVGDCDCDTLVKAKLELANRAWELGDKDKAHEIWDEVAKEYKLLER